MTTLRRHLTGWKPALSYPIRCGFVGDCTFQHHEDGYLDAMPNQNSVVPGTLSCFVGDFYDSECPREHRQPRPVNTFALRLREWEDGTIAVTICDDDDTFISLHKRNPKSGQYEAIARWLDAICMIDIPAIESRLVGWEHY